MNKKNTLSGKLPKGNLSYRSNGKLLLTGEYLVLKGAKALAIPLRFGQDLLIEIKREQLIDWSSNINGENWLDVQFSLPHLNIISTNNNELANRLQKVLQSAKILNNNFLSESKGYQVTANIDFNIEWGLGSSSTLISNVAGWAKCNPNQLNQFVFGGSGYDIACASSKSPIIYQLKNGQANSKPVNFNPPFKDHLTFVWLNKKQNSREAINRFDQSKDYQKVIEQINNITMSMTVCTNLIQFKELMNEHETLMANVIETNPVKKRLFPDFDGSIKSLGAWGGDFIMTASEKTFSEVKNYFKQKGHNTVFSYNEIIYY